MRHLLLLALLPLLACAGAAPDAARWEEVAQAELGPAQRAQLDAALAAKDELMGALLEELTAALLEGPPAGAIGVCKDVAPRIAREVGAQRGLAIGRTSFALRNAANVPPAWAAPLVEQRTAEPRTLAGDDGRLGVLLPIRLGPQCVACHGPAETLDADVRAALASAYPEDRATGFSPGDLRGWFWVEVP